MNAKKFDLISIANAGLAEKLETAEKKAEQQAQQSNSTPATQKTHTFKQDVWTAIYTLNILRYSLSVFLMFIVWTLHYRPSLNPIQNILYPNLFASCALLILISAILFSYIIKQKIFPFNTIILIQFSLDTILATLLIHSTGSIGSSFILLYFMLVATGSIVLPKTSALGLAAGAIILMFFEHFYSLLKTTTAIDANYGLLVSYSITMMIIAWIISYFAGRLRIAELKTFVPGNETIEQFLVREETQALESALQKTNGNKTEAAKLLGMTFRSFRYKLSKYDIG